MAGIPASEPPEGFELDSPLVGRDMQVSRILSVRQSVLRGKGRVVLLSGEPSKGEIAARSGNAPRAFRRRLEEPEHIEAWRPGQRKSGRTLVQKAHRRNRAGEVVGRRPLAATNAFHSKGSSWIMPPPRR